ncbi:MAG TPA: hypothetical protein VGS97_15555 [Actinocrinis sp.]|uniref:hypothetical protein n=1 Tax=Actinocrinis sp. TaxID=1920516 RepID=UPI002DDCD684|nr:hypothetical protein [Actinocrinis sp.]HEV2345514.1 hypothetical protein [Actinocrinis sp.]
MWWRVVVGVVMCAVGGVWIGQGSGAIRGSVMTGHSQYTALGAVVAAVGVLLLVWAGMLAARRRGADQNTK